MEDQIKTWLTDIKLCIEEINEFLPDKKNFFEFQKDVKTRKAIERNIEIIGEAANRIFKLNADIKITNVRKIIATRNRIIHGYDSVSEDIVWSIVVRDFPELLIEVQQLLIE